MRCHRTGGVRERSPRLQFTERQKVRVVVKRNSCGAPAAALFPGESSIDQMHRVADALGRRFHRTQIVQRISQICFEEYQINIVKYIKYNNKNRIDYE